MHISGQPFYKYLPSKHLPLTPNHWIHKIQRHLPEKTQGPRIKHAQKCGGVKPVHGIHNLLLDIRISDGNTD